MPNLAWIIGDQLTPSNSALQLLEKKHDYVLMVESLEHASLLNHHKHKLILCFSAMRHFREELIELGYQVLYFELEENHSFQTALKSISKKNHINRIFLMEPHEKATVEFASNFNHDPKIELTPNTMFLTDRHAFIKKNKKKKHLVMEPFYREMRKKHRVLLEKNGQPTGGAWNFDKENRLPLKSDVKLPEVYSPKKDKIDRDVIGAVEKYFPNNPGHTQDFSLPTTREESEIFFHDFVKHRLPLFGKYEDAMLANESILFHSSISPLLNIGLLDPLKLVRDVEACFKKNHAPINSVEGFIRQIIGWREFIYACYWLKMSETDYHKENFFNNTHKLPEFFWTGNTKMNCLSQVINRVIKHGYSHHIERLMILGNFALLFGVKPEEINQWFWEFYVDSYDWVVTPNVIGMSQFADGGLVATKPYAASANYISKMSNFCHSCSYNKTERTGKNACPFNYLYWDFYLRNEEKLRGNSRIGMAYQLLEKKSADELVAIRTSADEFREKIKPNSYY
ncbi:MAG: cryptochrome/photolyase family protein [Chloroherpetonaceae bacterium]|nr:cryptochrome/photolyase family protein [Chloroherpetonaceae bacterium]